jgi:hypothetical protein
VLGGMPRSEDFQGHPCSMWRLSTCRGLWDRGWIISENQDVIPRSPVHRDQHHQMGLQLFTRWRTSFTPLMKPRMTASPWRGRRAAQVVRADEEV